MNGGMMAVQLSPPPSCLIWPDTCRLCALGLPCPPQVAALVHEYEATAALRELTVQADAARPPARSCRADLGRLLESRLCADVTLAYRGTAFPAHRALLSARCPFFRDLLSDGTGGARQQQQQQMVRGTGSSALSLL